MCMGLDATQITDQVDWVCPGCKGGNGAQQQVSKKRKAPDDD